MADDQLDAPDSTEPEPSAELQPDPPSVTDTEIQTHALKRTDVKIADDSDE